MKLNGIEHIQHPTRIEMPAIEVWKALVTVIRNKHSIPINARLSHNGSKIEVLSASGTFSPMESTDDQVLLMRSIKELESKASFETMEN
jgi:hypothetical protein